MWDGVRFVAHDSNLKGFKYVKTGLLNMLKDYNLVCYF